MRPGKTGKGKRIAVRIALVLSLGAVLAGAWVAIDEQVGSQDAIWSYTPQH